MTHQIAILALALTPALRIPTNETVKAAPVTFLVDGRQYIAAGANILCFGPP